MLRHWIFSLRFVLDFISTDISTDIDIMGHKMKQMSNFKDLISMDTDSLW